MKTVILTCNTGQGHNSVSKAIEEAYNLKGDECTTIDALSFISERASSIISSWHTKLYRYLPKVSDSAYRIAETHPSLFEEGSLIRQFLVSGAEKLYIHLKDNGYDSVICPHVFSSLMMTQLKLVHPDYNVKTSFITTDYTFAPITSEIKADVYFVPDNTLVDLYSHMGIPKEKIRSVTGIPVRRSFYNIADKGYAKEKLGIDPNFKHIIMMFGSMGCGPIPKLTAELSKLLPKDAVLTVICGTNEMLKKLLTFTHKEHDNIRIEGFVSDISLMMDSADLYVTKPGGLSTSEARIKHLPMVLVNAVAGCEQNNLEFFVSKGAAVTAKDENEIAKLCIKLLKAPNELRKMSEVFDDKRLSADEIYEIMREVS